MNQAGVAEYLLYDAYVLIRHGVTKYLSHEQWYYAAKWCCAILNNIQAAADNVIS